MSLKILDEVDRYYSATLREHGATPRGVDWRDEQTQRRRFAELLRIVDGSGTVLDFGCGYGALLDVLPEGLGYVGYDISAEMIAHARSLHSEARFGTDRAALIPVEFVVASGLFNVKQRTPIEEWQTYVLEGIAELNRLSTRGFAFNLLTTYSDPDRMRPDLYYGDPLSYFDLAKRRYGKQVALLHDYGLYEFTILVRKS